MTHTHSLPPLIDAALVRRKGGQSQLFPVPIHTGRMSLVCSSSLFKGPLDTEYTRNVVISYGGTKRMVKIRISAF